LVVESAKEYFFELRILEHIETKPEHGRGLPQDIWIIEKHKKSLDWYNLCMPAKDVHFVLRGRQTGRRII
jgi:hypothetical protein